MNKTLAVALFALVAASVPADAQRLRDRLARGEAPAADRTIAFGSDPQQKPGLGRGKGAPGPAPLVLFVPGGGWQRGSKDNATGRAKATHYPHSGYAFASIDYRLV